MKIKTQDLIGPALVWAVAKTEGALAPLGKLYLVGQQLFLGVGGNLGEPGELVLYDPTTDFVQAYLIIEREGIGCFCNRTAAVGARFKPDAGADWRAFAYKSHGTHFYGPTPMIAAMRCHVASKLGDEINIPEELL